MLFDELDLYVLNMSLHCYLLTDKFIDFSNVYN